MLNLLFSFCFMKYNFIYIWICSWTGFKVACDQCRTGVREGGWRGMLEARSGHCVFLLGTYACSEFWNWRPFPKLRPERRYQFNLFLFENQQYTVRWPGKLYTLVRVLTVPGFPLWCKETIIVLIFHTYSNGLACIRPIQQIVNPIFWKMTKC